VVGKCALAVVLCAAAGVHAGVAEQAPMPVEVEPKPALLVAAGLGTGVADNLGVMPGARAELRLPVGFAFAIVGESRTHTNYRESSTALLAGYRRGVARGWFDAWAGLELGAGVIGQTAALMPGAYSGEAMAAPCVGLDVRVGVRTAIGLEATVPVTVLRRDGATTALALPAVWLGAVMDL
jgi:hypothetical protein